MGGIHFYQRVERHSPDLRGREEEVERTVRSAMRGMVKKSRVHVHPTHVHVFTKVAEKKQPLLARKIKEGLCTLGVRWDPGHYMTPVASLSDRYISRLLEELHRNPLI